MDDARAKTLITVEELTRLLDAKTPVVLLDVLDEAGAAPDDRPKIPGALSVNLATDFSGKPTALSGRRPLPDINELQAKARAWGIRGDSVVVVYDNAGGAQASRAWWTLRWARPEQCPHSRRRPCCLGRGTSARHPITSPLRRRRPAMWC